MDKSQTDLLYNLYFDFEIFPNKKRGKINVDTLDTGLSILSSVSSQNNPVLVNIQTTEQNTLQLEGRGDPWSIRVYSNELGYCTFHNTGNFKLLIAGSEKDFSTDYVRLEEPIWGLVYFLPKTMFYNFEETSKYCRDIFSKESLDGLVAVDQPL